MRVLSVKLTEKRKRLPRMYHLFAWHIRADGTAHDCWCQTLFKALPLYMDLCIANYTWSHKPATFESVCGTWHALLHLVTFSSFPKLSLSDYCIHLVLKLATSLNSV